MTDERLPSKGNIRFKWHPEGAFANPAWPTDLELNAGQDLEGATVWDGFEIGAQASETSESTTIKTKSSVAARAAANYGGSATFLYPGNAGDMVNLASLVYALFKEVNRPGYISASVDGEIGEPGQPPADYSYEVGDYVSIFAVMTDAWDDMITGEERFTYSRDFIKNGFMRTYTVVSGAAGPTVETVPTTLSVAPDAIDGVQVLVNGRDWTRGARFSIDDLAVATPSPSGLVRGVAAGSAELTVTLPRTSAAATVDVTVA